MTFLAPKVAAPVAKAIMETSAVMPMVGSMLKFADVDALRSTLASVLPPGAVTSSLQSAAQAAPAAPRSEPATPPALTPAAAAPGTGTSRER